VWKIKNKEWKIEADLWKSTPTSENSRPMSNGFCFSLIFNPQISKPIFETSVFMRAFVKAKLASLECLDVEKKI
jgi:hypothetical protein